MDQRHTHPAPRQGSTAPVRHPSGSSMKRHYGELGGPGASGESRLEKKKSLTPKSSKDGNGLQTDTTMLQDTINDLKAELEKFRKTCTCVICQELLFEPYFLQCGHVYCYNCIVQWVKQAAHRKSRCCPECRIPLTMQPAPAYPVRNMIELFVNRAEIHSPPGLGSELREQQLEMAALVKKDTQGPGLFEGLFAKKPRPRGVRDRDDGILRCPECAWEVHHGRCENPACNIRVSGADFSDEDSEEERFANRFLANIGEHWIESEFDTELTAEEADDTDEDGWELERATRAFPAGSSQDDESTEEEEDDDDEPVTNRSRRSLHDLDMDSDEISDSDTEGSMADFVVHDTPEVTRTNRGGSRPNRNAPPWTLDSSSPVAEPVQPVRRANARPIIIDDDDEDPSSMSEASSRPGFRPVRRVQMDLSSDYDEDEEESALLRTGYQSLGHQTASENEDDVVYRSRRRRPFTQSIREEDETEFETYDESEDTDGDIQMGEPVSRSGNSRINSGRSYGGATLTQAIELDSADDSDLPVTRNRRGRRAPVPSGGRNNYFSSHARGSNSRGNGNRPLSALVDPNIASLFQSHGQRLAEHQLIALGGRRSSVSPARSITPVQRDITGDHRRPTLSRETTPLASDHTPTPFSPLQSAAPHNPPMRRSRQASITSEQTSFSPQQTPEPQQQPRRTRTLINISSTTATPVTTRLPPQSNPISPSAPTGSNATLNARLASLSPGLGNRNPFTANFSSLNQPPVHRVSSPGVRVRPRTSRNQLRSSSSRSGLRGNPAHQSPIPGSGTFMSNSIAATLGRQTTNTGGTGIPPGRGRQWTPEDIRRLGMQVLQNPLSPQQQQQQQGPPQPGPRPSRPMPGSSREVSVESSVTLSPPPPSRRSLSVASEQSGNGRNGGGPVLVLGNSS